MIRRTKILATLGPATDNLKVLRKTLAAGVDVVRLNYSHGTADDQARRAEQVRKVAAELGRDIGIQAFARAGIPPETALPDAWCAAPPDQWRNALNAEWYLKLRDHLYRQ